ncbi:MAG: hypothetical protein M0R03_23735, partial [Novosphingobium sp.]|nr:hypothetical protein [Novosphingobium sp.]
DSSSKKFLEQAFEYRFGKKFKAESQYNFAMEVGKNNLYLNGKLVPDLTFARIHTTLYLSKLFKTPLDVRLGYSKEISNFVLKDVRALDKTDLKASVSSKSVGVGASIKIDQGKIKSYDGILDFKFKDGMYSSGIKYTDNRSSKFISIQGHTKVYEGKAIFMPLVQIGFEYTKNGKKIPFGNYALYYAPNQKIEIYLHRNVSNRDKAGLYIEINYLLGKTKTRKVLDVRQKEIKPVIEKKPVKDKQEKTKDKAIIEKIKKTKDKAKKDGFLKNLFKRELRLDRLKKHKGYPMIKKPKRPR